MKILEVRCKATSHTDLAVINKKKNCSNCNTIKKFHPHYSDKKENEILYIYKEIQMGAVAKSYMRKGFLIYDEKRK
jgi:hypothetical protein